MKKLAILAAMALVGSLTVAAHAAAETAVRVELKHNESQGQLQILVDGTNGVKLHVGQKYKGGTTFFGEKGTIHVNRGTILSTPAEILKEEIGPQEIHLYASGNHGGNWLECIKTRKLPICDVEIGHRTATVCHLGNICALLGGKLRWDPAKEQFVGNEKASAMIGRSYRAPWKL